MVTFKERATDTGKNGEDWTLLLEICDCLNESDEGPREAVRAIRKRLTSSAGKDQISIWYTLTLIETCIKYCGKRFQCQLANKDFLKDLLKVLSPKNDPSVQIQTRILLLIKHWVESEWNVPGRRELEKVYLALKQKGVQFPTSDQTEVVYASCGSAAPEVCNYRARIVANSLTPTAEEANSVAVVQMPRRPIGATSGVYVQLPPDDSSGPVSGIIIPAGALEGKSRGHHYKRKTPNVQLRQQQQQQQSALRYHVVQSSNAIAENGRPCLTIVPAEFAEETGTQRRQLVRRQMQAPVAVTARSSSGGGEHAQIDEQGTVRRLSNSQRIKLAQDLNVVETNLRVFVDMLSELRPDQTDSDDLHLLHELHRTCRAMQKRVVDFLSQVADERATVALLQVNDSLNAAFLKFNRFEKYRQKSIRSALLAMEGHRRQDVLPQQQPDADEVTDNVNEQEFALNERLYARHLHHHKHTHFHRHRHLHSGPPPSQQQPSSVSPNSSSPSSHSCGSGPTCLALPSPTRASSSANFRPKNNSQHLADRQKLLNEIRAANLRELGHKLDNRRRRRHVIASHAAPVHSDDGDDLEDDTLPDQYQRLVYRTSPSSSSAAAALAATAGLARRDADVAIARASSSASTHQSSGSGGSDRAPRTQRNHSGKGSAQPEVEIVELVSIEPTAASSTAEPSPANQPKPPNEQAVNSSEDEVDANNLSAELEDLEKWLQTNGIVDLDPYRPLAKSEAYRGMELPGARNSLLFLENQTKANHQHRRDLINREQMQLELASLFNTCLPGDANASTATADIACSSTSSTVRTTADEGTATSRSSNQICPPPKQRGRASQNAAAAVLPANVAIDTLCDSRMPARSHFPAAVLHEKGHCSDGELESLAHEGDLEDVESMPLEIQSEHCSTRSCSPTSTVMTGLETLPPLRQALSKEEAVMAYLQNRVVTDAKTQNASHFSGTSIAGRGCQNMCFEATPTQSLCSFRLPKQRLQRNGDDKGLEANAEDLVIL